MFSEQEIMNKVFNGTDSLLISTNPTPRGGALDDVEEIWNAVFDSTNNLIRFA